MLFRFLMILICHCFYGICNAESLHMPFGSHSIPTESINDLKDFPLPTEFYTNFVVPSKPFIIKNALNRNSFPAFEKWTDAYLNNTYGDMTVEMEPGKKDNRERPIKFVKFKDFLSVYNASSVYLVTDMVGAFKDDVTIPRTLQCGGFQNVIDESVLWFSSGGTKSQLHKDAYENINCVLDGQKDVIMIDKVHRGAVEADHWVTEKGYSKLDVERFDAYRFPNLKDVPWYSIKVSKGDCLYIPIGWYHQINSPPGRSLAINIWFRKLLWFNESDCEQETKLQVKPYSQFKTTSLEYRIKDHLANLHQREVTRPEFLDKFVFEEFALFAAKEFFNFLDNDKDGSITLKEVYSFNYSQLYEQLPGFCTRYYQEFYSEMLSRDQKYNSGTEDIKVKESFHENLNLKGIPDKSHEKEDHKIDIADIEPKDKTQIKNDLETHAEL